tara:strand:- start:34 stop:225 length:192 start_codon:yes stop_codon:yes gene_type:complete
MRILIILLIFFFLKGCSKHDNTFNSSNRMNIDENVFIWNYETYKDKLIKYGKLNKYPNLNNDL